MQSAMKITTEQKSELFRQRAQTAYQLRIADELTFAEIGKHLGVSHVTAIRAYNYQRNLLEQNRTDHADAIRQEVTIRLRDAIHAIEDQALSGDNIPATTEYRKLNEQLAALYITPNREGGAGIELHLHYNGVMPAPAQPDSVPSKVIRPTLGKGE